MSKWIINLIVATLLAVSLRAQGLIQFSGINNTNTSPAAHNNGRVFLQSSETDVLDTKMDINVELIYGTTAANVSPSNVIVTLLLNSTQVGTNASLGGTYTAQGDITVFGNGQLWDNSGINYQITAPLGNGLYVEVLAWTGNFSSYSAALDSGSALVGSTGPFHEYLGETYPGNIQFMPALLLRRAPAPKFLTPIPKP